VPPTILVQPKNQILLTGGVARFTAVATGGLPLNYDWRRDGIDLADDGRIWGANSSNLIISNVVPSDSGVFTLTVSNHWGSAISSNAALLVYAIDHFAWDPIPSPRFVNLPFRVRIQALDATNGLVSRFDGGVVLRSTTGISVTPAVSGAFEIGTWTGSVTFAQEATNTILVADDGSGHLGYANPINVISLPSLSVTQSGGSLFLSWPAKPAAFALEKSVDLSSWSPLTNSIFLIGEQYQTRVRISDVKAFYRLRFDGP